MGAIIGYSSRGSGINTTVLVGWAVVACRSVLALIDPPRSSLPRIPAIVSWRAIYPRSSPRRRIASMPERSTRANKSTN